VHPAQDLGGVHLVINNAGIAHSGDVEVMSLSEMQRVMDVDFWGVVNGTQAFLPHLIASGDGHLVNISSLFGLVSMPSQSAYNAAKYAVRGFTEALRMELLIAKHPVQVTCVHPGGIRTAIARTATASQGLDPSSLAELFDTKLARMSPEKAARIILRGTARGRARVLVGADAHAAHWLAKLLGSRYQVLLARAAARILPGTGAPGTATDSDRPALSRDRAAPPPAG
jgi:short-subunit dehydrogenase